jgi:hypothetical protein
MDRRKFSAIAIGFGSLVVLVIALLLSNSLRRSSHIVLPAADAAAASASASQSQGGGGVVTVDITPQTVQSAIASLERPASYARVLTCEYLWSGGNASFQATVKVSGGWTRTDTAQIDGRQRHVLTDGSRTYVWYDSQREYYAGAAGDVTADQEQHLPTYEDILQLDADRITAADYRVFAEENCIYVETAPDDAGYSLRYWVSTSTGLLTGAERLCKGESVFRAAAQPLLETAPTAADFTLPDGTALLKTP